MEQITAKTVEEAIERGLKRFGKSIDEVEWEVVEEDSKGFLGLIGKKDAVVRMWPKGEKKESDFYLDKAKDESQNEKDLISHKMSEEIREEQLDKTKAPIIKETMVVKDEEQNKRGLSKGETSEVDLELLDKKKEIAEEVLYKIFDFMEIEVRLSSNVDSTGININIGVDETDKGIVIGRRAQTLDAVQYITTLLINKDGNFVRLFLDVEGYREEREEILKSFARKMANKALKGRRAVRLEPMNPYERRIIHSELQSFKGVYTYSEGNEPERYVVIGRK